MEETSRIAVTSRVFSRNAVLRQELLARYRDVLFNDTGKALAGSDLVAFLTGRDRAIVSLERIDENLLSRLPELRTVSKYGVGLDNIDLAALERHGVSLGWRGGVNRRAVSELALAFMLIALRNLQVAHQVVTSGNWRQPVGAQLSGRTVGIIGCGFIGKDLVELLAPLGCPILAHDIRDYRDFYHRKAVTPLGLEALLSRAEVVTLHVPLDASTRNILSAERLALMKPGAVLINTARGGLVDEKALKERLIKGQLAAAAFDVYAVEPPIDSELMQLPNFYSTPHIGGSSEEAILAMGRAAIDGLSSSHPVSFYSDQNRDLTGAREISP
jgi:D-3-phosphoglycerate dehydrogenase